MSALLGLLAAMGSLVRWGEPWDIEHDDPLLDRDGVEGADLWA